MWYHRCRDREDRRLPNLPHHPEDTITVDSGFRTVPCHLLQGSGHAAIANGRSLINDRTQLD